MLDTSAFDKELKLLYAEKWKADVKRLIEQANSTVPFIRDYARKLLGICFKPCKRCDRMFHFKHGNQKLCPTCKGTS